MVKAFKLFTIICFLSMSSETLMAAPYRRLVNFEWEAIENAQTYEVEIKSIKEDGNGKIYQFKVDKAAWNGRLSAGKYLMKLRSIDERGVPGEWNQPSEFDVGLENAVIKYPSAETQITSYDKVETKLELQWEPVGGADEYSIDITSLDGQFQSQNKTDKSSFSISLPVAKKYTWTVTALNKEGFKSEAPATTPFTILGPPLELPTIAKPENEFVREVHWSHNEDKTLFDASLFKYNSTQKKWDKVKFVENTKDTFIPIDSSYSGGQYQLLVVAKGELRATSKKAKQIFKVRDGDRSPAAEFTSTLRKSIERFEGWYGVASYLVTKMQFKGINYEKNSFLSYEALGGTGRLGLGWFKPEKNWGFLSIVDLSGFTFNGETKTFASVELNAVHRQKMMDRGELRIQFGPYFKELPEAIRISEGVHKYDSISVAGAHSGVEYWYSLSPKIGLQAHLYLYYSLLTGSTPNGQEISPTLSTQWSLLGSYRLTDKLTGLAGYTRREDKTAYKVNSANGSMAPDGTLNESTIAGDYLSFFAEWNF